MARDNWLVAVAGICLLSACSSDGSGQSGDYLGGTGGAAGAAGVGSGAGGGLVAPSGGAPTSTGGTASGVGGVAGVGGAGSGGTPIAPGGAPFDYNAQTVQLDADLVIPAGKTVRVGPGVTFNAAPKVAVRVEGTLVVSGSVASPDHFMGRAQGPNSWSGIVVAAGGNLQMQDAQVGGATLGLHALKGSTYDIDRVTFDTSFKGAVLESDGKINHSRFLATVPPTVSLASDVTIDDPNGTMTIMAASPIITNSEFIGASPLTDLVRIGGDSAPSFDHDTFKAAHCGFHIFGATTKFTTVTGSVIEGMSYGVMAFTTKPSFKGNVFKGNSADAGFCLGGTVANAPIFDGNFHASGVATFDPSCVQAGTTAVRTLTTAIPDAGPAGL